MFIWTTRTPSLFNIFMTEIFVQVEDYSSGDGLLLTEKGLEHLLKTPNPFCAFTQSIVVCKKLRVSLSHQLLTTTLSSVFFLSLVCITHNVKFSYCCVSLQCFLQPSFSFFTKIVVYRRNINFFLASLRLLRQKKVGSLERVREVRVELTVSASLNDLTPLSSIPQSVQLHSFDHRLILSVVACHFTTIQFQFNK